MRLTDTLEVVDSSQTVLATVPAHVGTVATAVTSDAGEPVVMAEQLRALVKPDRELHTAGTLYRWRGDVYTAPAPPIVRRQGARDHHYTLTLERGSGA